MQRTVLVSGGRGDANVMRMVAALRAVADQPGEARLPVNLVLSVGGGEYRQTVFVYERLSEQRVWVGVGEVHAGTT